MTSPTYHLKGSPSRDAFKLWHKLVLPKSFYATDFDLALVSGGRIVAILDYKKPGEPVTFTEAEAYVHLLELGLRVFLVTANPTFPAESAHRRLSVYRAELSAKGLAWPPIMLNASEADFQTWEATLRQLPSEAKTTEAEVDISS